jgi:hypothetical protein
MSRPRHTIRTMRRCATALVVVPIVASTVAAQQPQPVALPNARRSFEDSWYWGAKGGAVRFGTNVDGRLTAPLAGGEWLITRSHSALLVSAEQAFFDRTSAVADPYATDGTHSVSIKDARRYSAAALAAPASYGRFRPYVGLGLALQVIRDATPTGDFATPAQSAYVNDRVDAGQSSASAFILGGVQAQVGRFAVFAQASTASAQRRSLWNMGGASQFEGGVRYNLSSAFER